METTPAASQNLGQLYQTKQGLYVLDPRDQFVSKALIEQGLYSQAEQHLISQFLTKSHRLLWLGPHIGSLLIPLAPKVAHITAIEANPNTYKLFTANLKLNDIDNVTAHNLAAGEGAGHIDFVLNTQNGGASKRKPLTTRDMYYYDKPEITKVKMADMDSLLARQSFDFLFMDIEGSEYFALKGMPNLLKNVQIIYMEFLPFLIKDSTGKTAGDLCALISEFQTLVLPRLRQVAHGAEIAPLLNRLFDENHCENGILLFRQRTDIHLA